MNHKLSDDLDWIRPLGFTTHKPEGQSLMNRHAKTELTNEQWLDSLSPLEFEFLLLYREAKRKRYQHAQPATQKEA